MKLPSLLLLTILLFLGYTGIAQTGSFYLAQKYPEAGQQVTLYYRPVKPLKTPPNVLISFWGLPVPGRNEVCYQLIFSNGKWACQFKIPQHTTTFSVMLTDGTDDTFEWTLAYQSLIYRNKKPVNFAYSQMAKNWLLNYDSDSGKTAKGEMLFNWYQQEAIFYPKRSMKIPSASLIRITDPAVVDEKINEFLKIGSVATLDMAYSLLISLDRIDEATAVEKQIRGKFPRSEKNERALASAYRNEPDLVKKELLLDQYFTLFPNDSAQIRRVHRINTASGLLYKYDLKGYEEQRKLIKPGPDLAAELLSVSERWEGVGDNPDLSAKVARQALDMWLSTKEDEFSLSDTQWRVMTYHNMLYNLSAISLRRKDVKGALGYLEKIAHYGWEQDFKYYRYYTPILLAMGQNSEALKLTEEHCPGWQNNLQWNKQLKPVYLKLKGDAEAFTADSIAGQKRLDEIFKPNIRKGINDAKAEFSGQMLNVLAPNFVLKGLDGKTVSLKSLRGQTVVVMFGASWTDLCYWPARSIHEILSGIDTPVTMVLVNTFNTGDRGQTAMRAIAERHRYTFPVLNDDSTSSVARAYHAEGLPALFVIDKKGRIRFKADNMSPRYFADRYAITAMVELANAAP